MVHFLKYEYTITQYSKIEGVYCTIRSTPRRLLRANTSTQLHIDRLQHYLICRILLSSSGPLTPADYANGLKWLSTIAVVEKVRLPDHGTQ